MSQSPFQAESVAWMARAGLCAKAFVYATVGVLALMTTLHLGSGTITGQRGALKQIDQQPFGQWILLGLSLGLAAYALWRFIQGFYNTESEDDDFAGWAKRGSYIIRGLIYTGLSITTLREVLPGLLGSGSSQSSWLESIMAQPFGVLLIAAIGVGIGIAAVFQVYKVMTQKYKDELHFSEMAHKEQQLFRYMAPVGLLSRGLVFAIMCYFFLSAALNHDASQAKGLGGALQSIMAQQYGTYLLGVISTGLLLYAAYEFLKARYLKLTFA